MHKRLEIKCVALHNKLLRVVWNVFRIVFFRPFPTKLFWPLRWCVLKLFGAKVSIHANVYASARIWAPWNLSMAKGSCLGPHTICYNQAMVVLEDNSIVSQYAYLCTAGHDSSMNNTANDGLIVSGITLHRGSWIGTSAFVGMGVEIGENAIVGAASAVFKDVEPQSIVGGNPAVFIKKRDIEK